jgi:hypothetical protein
MAVAFFIVVVARLSLEYRWHPSEGGRRWQSGPYKSWLFTRVVPEQGFINVRAGALDDPSWFAPFVETYTSEALPWARTGARHSYPQFPAIEEYGPLVAEFAAA